MGASSHEGRLDSARTAGAIKMRDQEWFSIYQEISTPASGDEGQLLYSVREISGYTSYLIGKDSNERSCLLIATSDRAEIKPSPVRLENVDVQFDLPCQTTRPDGGVSEGVFTVVRCRSMDSEIIRYFLSVCQIIVANLGEVPSKEAITDAVRHLISIFKSIKNPPTRSLMGLFGEMFVISRSQSPARAIAAWRLKDTSRFDFTADEVRIDVKTTSGRDRKHRLSYEQCTPPPDTQAIAISIMTERIAGGLSLRDLIALIEAQVAENQDAMLKLHEVVISTLGMAFSESLDVTFDEYLAESSLRYYDLQEIPAIRDPLPPDVSEVRFTVNLSGASPLDDRELVDRIPQFWQFVSRLPEA